MNAMSIILKVVVIVVGVLLLTDAVFSLAKRRMTETFCLMWGLVSIITIIGGCIIRPSRLSSFMSPISFVLILMIFFLLIYIALVFSHTISDLMRKNTELAIQVSLLMHEKEEMKKQLEKLDNAETSDAKDKTD